MSVGYLINLKGLQVDIVIHKKKYGQTCYVMDAGAIHLLDIYENVYLYT